jgi:hypothetical protein
MSGVSIEETLELWAASLRDAKARMRPLFTQERVRHRPVCFLMDCWRRSDAKRGEGLSRRDARLRADAYCPGQSNSQLLALGVSGAFATGGAWDTYALPDTEDGVSHHRHNRR